MPHARPNLMVPQIATHAGEAIRRPLPKLPSPPGVSLRLERTKGRRMRLTIVNRSNRTVVGHRYAFNDHNRAFARSVTGGPILTERDWVKGLVPKAYAGYITFRLEPHAALPYAEEDLVARLRLPRGVYHVWDLAYDTIVGTQMVSNVVTVRVP